MESTWAREVENVVVLASIQEDAEGLIHKVSLPRVNLGSHVRPRRWPKRSSTICLMRQLMVHGS
jgi:hypothetical protein